MINTFKVQKRVSPQSGQIFILAIIVMLVVLINTLLIIGGAMLYRQNSIYSLEGSQALNLAEAGIDKAVASLNASAGSYSGENETALGNGSYSIIVTSKNSTTKTIASTGFVPNKQKAKAKRTIKIEISRGTGNSFYYGLQVGDGGLFMDENSLVNGSVYSNGNIEMRNNSKILGDGYVAGGIQPTPDQEGDCVSPNCGDFIFGKNVSGENRLDIAASFQATSSAVLNKVSLKLKKFGSPSDLTVRILADSSGNPDKSNVLTSGVLTANLVTTSYGFVDVIFTTTPQLLVDTPYWILLDTFSDNNNYWSWSVDTLSGYSRGKGVWTANWQAASASWMNITGDLGFKTFMGGVATSIIGSNGVIIGGDAHANTLSDLTVTKGAYYQLATNVTAANYYPNSPDPLSQVMPISNGNIADWKLVAETNGVIIGDITTCPATLASKKYVGNISLPQNCTVIIEHPIWVTGYLTLGGFDVIKLDPTSSNSSGVFLVDGVITLENNNSIKGTGQAGSYLMLISEFDSKANPTIDAINVRNNGNTGILYSNTGSIYVANNNSLTAVTAYKLKLSNNVTINYDIGLSGVFFSSGPSGAFSVVKGTYQIK